MCERGYDRKRGTFTQYYGSEELDAAVLTIPIVGFLPGIDPRVTGTIDAVRAELGHDGFISRYSTAATDDGLPGTEAQFLACSFWLVTALAMNGRNARSAGAVRAVAGAEQRPGALLGGVRRRAPAADWKLPAGIYSPYDGGGSEDTGGAGRPRRRAIRRPPAGTRESPMATTSRSVMGAMSGHKKACERRSRRPGAPASRRSAGPSSRGGERCAEGARPDELDRCFRQQASVRGSRSALSQWTSLDSTDRQSSDCCFRRSQASVCRVGARPSDRCRDAPMPTLPPPRSHLARTFGTFSQVRHTPDSKR